MGFRIAASFIVLSLASWLNADDRNAKHLDMDGLDQVHAEYKALSEFSDNAFIFTDKITKFQEDLNKKLRGASFKIVLKARVIGFERVDFVDPGEEKESPNFGSTGGKGSYRRAETRRRGLEIVFVDQDDKAPFGQDPDARLGVRTSNDTWLKVRNPVPLELAKVLRRNDLVYLEGRVKGVLTTTQSFKLVVSEPRVSKLTEKEAKEFLPAKADAADSPVVNIPAAYIRYAGYMITKYDTDNDGVVDKDEWGKSGNRWSKSKTSPDTDEDGKITKKELALFLFNREGA